MEYLILPFALRNGYLNRGDLQESIVHSVGLILSTRAGQMPFAPEFGSEVWEREYSDIFSASKADIRAALRNAIDTLEKRLYNVSISFTPSNPYAAHRLGMVVKVTANYRDNGEEKKFEAAYQLA